MADKVPPMTESQAVENTVQTMKNNLSKMREGGLTKHLREKAFKWKDL